MVSVLNGKAALRGYIGSPNDPDHWEHADTITFVGNWSTASAPDMDSEQMGSMVI